MNPFQSMPDVNSPDFIPYFQSQDRFSRKLGYKALQASPGKSEYEIEVDETFHNPVHIVHGAALFAAMDKQVRRWPVGSNRPEESVNLWRPVRQKLNIERV